jgi:hypothetical protein
MGERGLERERERARERERFWEEGTENNLEVVKKEGE